MSEKFLIALQFYPGDKENAMRLARLITDFQKVHSTEADFLFAARFDTIADPKTVEYVSRKFNVYSMVSRRKGTGWPFGTTELVCSALEWAYSNIRAARCPRYKAVFTCEGDGVPLVSDWISSFSAAWDGFPKGTKVAGDIDERPNCPRHINGNAFFSTDPYFLNWMVSKALPLTPPQAPWDIYLAKAFETRGWSRMPGLRNYWQTPTMNYAWYAQELAQSVKWIHGVKDSSLYDLIRSDQFGVKKIKPMNNPEFVKRIKRV